MSQRISVSQSFKKHFIINILLLSLIVSCSSASPISISPAPTSTITTMLTVVLTPTSTIAQTLPPSLTPLPTIHPGDFALFFELLFATNGDCRLPCFWGMTPGKTTVAELLQFTGQFTMPGFDMVDTGDRVYSFRYPDFPTGNFRWVVQFFTNGEKVRGIDLIAETAQYSFPLSKVLTFGAS